MGMNLTDKAKNSKTFCVYPWIHIHTSPMGAIAPCCIGASVSNTDLADEVKGKRLDDLVNHDRIKQLRLDMLAGKKCSECKICYELEDAGVDSFRVTGLREYPEVAEELVTDTNIDGSLSNFEMRYFDMRFSNICNFKCRTCGQEYSSQWEQENLRNNVSYARMFSKGAETELLEDVLEQVPNFETAYFAGGEPLITEEHYIILEEMIRKGKTDVALRYNTNMSNIKFKNKDLMSLWKNFKHVNVSASIDHYGERAEYIRHGTNWSVVEENLKIAKESAVVNLSLNTVLSVFNFFTIDSFYKYMHHANIYTKNSPESTLYCMTSPDHLACHWLNPEHKLIGNESLSRAINFMEQENFREGHIRHIKAALNWSCSKDTSDNIDGSGYTNAINFRNSIEELDKIRGESFEKVFPELIPILESTYE
jgi:organic radical activating enzyme